MEPIPTRYFPSGLWEPRWARIDPERNLVMATPASTLQRPRVVIVGAGFGGLSAAKALGRVPVEVMVIDRHNYHLFQPLLYQAATGGLSPGDIAPPIRAILRHQATPPVMRAPFPGVNPARNGVLSGPRRISFDYLIL